MRCLLEIKSSAEAPGRRFIMSWNEWRRAQRAKESVSEAYYIVRVGGLSTAQPAIVEIIDDPIAAERAGGLLVREKALWITVTGAPT